MFRREKCFQWLIYILGTMPAFGTFSSIFSEKAFFHRNVRKILLLDNFCTNLSILVNISVISSSIQGYMAVKGLKPRVFRYILPLLFVVFSSGGFRGGVRGTRLTLFGPNLTYLNLKLGPKTVILKDSHKGPPSL